MSEKSLKQRVVEGVVWLTAVKIVGQVITWTITVYVMRLLSPNDYGLFAMAGVYISFAALFSEVGLSASIIQRRSITQVDLASIAWAVMLLNLLLFAFSFFVAPAIATFYDEPRVADVVRIASIVFIVRSLGVVPSNMLVRELMFDRQSQAEILGNVSGAVASLGFALNGFGVLSLVFGTIVVEVVRTIFCFVFYPWKPKWSFSYTRVKDMVDFGIKAAIARLMWYFSANLDVLIAGKILGKAQLGYYAIAVQIALIPLDKLMGSTISQVAFPAFSRTQDDPALLRRYYLKIVNVVAFASFPLCWGIYLAAESAVLLFLSEKWSAAILPLQILSLVAAFRAIHLVNAPLEMAVGRPGMTIRNFALITSIMAISFLVGSSYGLEGFAYSWLVFPVIFLIVTSITLRLVDISLLSYLRELKHPFLGTGLMVVVVLFFQKSVLVNYGFGLQLAGTIVSGALSYVAYYVLFNREMFAEAKSLLKR